MDQVIAMVGPEGKVEIVEHHSGKVTSRLFMTPQDAAYLARGILSCAAALCRPDPPAAGAIVSNSCIPALNLKTSPGAIITVTIGPGIELHFQMPTAKK